VRVGSRPRRPCDPVEGPSLPRGQATPDTDVDLVPHGVLEAGATDGAPTADALRFLVGGFIGGAEERLGLHLRASGELPHRCSSIRKHLGLCTRTAHPVERPAMSRIPGRGRAMSRPGAGPSQAVTPVLPACDEDQGWSSTSERMMTTGHSAWCAHCWLTDPSSRLLNPPRPREPTTSISAPFERSTSA
jgi:hypothetical protein